MPPSHRLSAANAVLSDYAAAADAAARSRYAQSLRPAALSALEHALGAPSIAAAALRVLWDSPLPRRALIRALLREPAPAALCEFDILVTVHADLISISACATGACKALSTAPALHHARRIALACARAARIHSASIAARIAAVTATYCLRDATEPAPAIVALVDAGFVNIAAKPAITATLNVRVDHVPATFHALLLVVARLSDDDTRAEVAAAACKLATRCSGAAVRACFLAFRTAMCDSTRVAHAVLDVYEQAVGNACQTDEFSMDYEHFRISATDVAFIYVILSCVDDDAAKKRILALLADLCTTSASLFAQSPVAGSSSAAALSRDERARAHVLLHALTLPGAEEWCALVADVCDSLLRAPKQAVRSWATRILATLFASQQGARQRVLTFIFDALADTHASSGADSFAATAYAALLNDLAANPGSAALFRAHVPMLSHWLAFLETMPFDAACDVMRALARIAATIPTLCDKLLLHLRKILPCRSRVARFLALHALVALVVAPGTTLPVVEEVATLLSHALARERDLRVPTLTLLVQALRMATPYARSHRWAPLNRTVLKYVDALIAPAVANGGVESDKSSSAVLRLSHCFAQCCEALAARRDAPLLLEYTSALRGTHNRAASIYAATEAHLVNPRTALVDACSPPANLSDSAKARWVNARVSMLAVLCEKMLSKHKSGQTTTPPVEHETPQAALVYALSFVVRDAIPVSLRARPVHERSCAFSSAADLVQGATGQSALASISARERCANESLVGSKQFTALETAGTLASGCGLSLSDSLSLLYRVKSIEQRVGQYTTSLMRAEVMEQLVRNLETQERLSQIDDIRQDVFHLAARAFSDTNPQSKSTPVQHVTTSASKPPMLRTDSTPRGTRTSLRRVSKTQNKIPKKRSRPPSQDRTPQKRVTRSFSNSPDRPDQSPATESSATRSTLGSIGDDLASEQWVDTSCSDIDSAISRIPFNVARDALSNALRKSTISCEHARLSTRASAIRILLRYASPSFNKSDWSFLFGSLGVKASAVECVREIVTLFERDFRRSLSNALALHYLEFFAWFIDPARCISHVECAAVRELLVGVATRILKEYTISQVRIVRTMFALLLNALDDDKAIAVVNQVFRWLGEQDGVLDDAYKVGGSRIESKSFDIDILEEACAMDGISPSLLNENMCPSTINVSKDGEVGHGISQVSRAPEKSLNSADPASSADTTSSESERDVLPENARIRELGLNDSEESCLVCIQTALIRLENAVPTTDTMRTLHKQSAHNAAATIARLSAATSALSALLATQRGTTVTWARPVARRVADTVARILNSANAALLCVRREMCNATSELQPLHFSAVLAVCAQTLRDCLGKRIIRALTITGAERTRRAAARLELHVPAALADLSAHCAGSPALQQITDAYHSIVGVAEIDRIEAVAEIDVPRSKTRKRSLRSRNHVVDAWLQDEDGDDNFADLEDFVVGMDEAAL